MNRDRFVWHADEIVFDDDEPLITARSMSAGPVRPPLVDLSFREKLIYNLEVQRNRCGQFGDDDSTCPVPSAASESSSRGAVKVPAFKAWEAIASNAPRPKAIFVKKVRDAIPLILAGQVVELSNPRKVNTLLHRLAKIAKDAEAKGEAAPNYDLCKVTVEGASFFCAGRIRTKDFPNGVPRLAMPQLGGETVPGSAAARLPHDDKNRVDAGPEFIDHLIRSGIKTSSESIRADRLIASQAELVGAKIAKRVANPRYTPSSSIFISRDNYIVDGHHRWATQVAKDAEDNKLGDITIRVIRIDAPITEILPRAIAWSTKFGMKPAAGSPTPAPRTKHLADDSQDDLVDGIDDVTTTEQLEDTLAESAPIDEPVALSARKAQKPRRLERKLMSLSDIPKTLDDALATLKAALPDALASLAKVRSEAMLRGPAEALELLLSTTMRPIADYGATEVRRELSRQGARLMLDRVHADADSVTASITSCATDLQDEIAQLKKTVLQKLKRRKLNADKRRRAAYEQIERRLAAMAGRYARRAINEAFATGRSTEIKRLSTATTSIAGIHLADVPPYVIEHVIMTAVLDSSLCTECAAVDGKVMDYGSDEQQELEPPYYNCLGGDSCRCVHLCVLKDGNLLEIVDGEITDDSGDVIDREEVISADEEDTIE